MNAPVDPRALLVPDDETMALYRHVVAFQAHQALTDQRRVKRYRWMLGGAGAIILGLSAAVTALYPLREVVPDFIYIGHLGVTDTATALSDLPATARQAAVEAELWSYLREREHYAPSEAAQSYDIVSAMSSATVKRQYQDWANPKLNPQSPATVLGKGGAIRIYRMNGSWLTHTPDYLSGVYQIQYCRLVEPENQTASAIRMTATLQYRVVTTIPFWERVTSNPIGLIVTEYPTPEIVSPTIKLVPVPGEASPCDH
jgi:type IV secretion system protein VirB8